MKPMEETRFVVTGATGFIGNNIVRELAGRGKQVCCFVRSRERAQTLFPDYDLDYATGTLDDPAGLRAALRPGDLVIHAAGKVSIGSGRQNRLDMYRVNVEGTKAVVDACLDAGVGRLVYLSSVHAIDEPPAGVPITETDTFEPLHIRGDYARTKAESTAYVFSAARERGLDAVIVHPSGVVGPYDFGATYLTKLVLDYAAHKIPAGVRGGYNFVDVRDVAQAVATAAELPQAGGNCYLLTGHYASVAEILDELHRLLGGRHIRRMLPMWTAKAALPFLNLYARVRRVEPLYNGYSLYTLSSNSDFRNDRAVRDLDFAPRPIADSIADTVAWLREQGRL